MNNYNLTAIKNKGEQTFLETPFYWGPGLPVFASKESIINELKDCFNENSKEIITSRKTELYWVNEETNLIVLERLLSSDENAFFMPEQYRKQVINAKKRQQPYCFFVEKGLRQNIKGLWELRLRQSCEAKPHQKGYKYGFNLSIVLGLSVHTILLDGNLDILDIVKHKNRLLPNTVFDKCT